MNSTIECRKCHSKNSINATLCYNCDESLQNYNYYKNDFKVYYKLFSFLMVILCLSNYTSEEITHNDEISSCSSCIHPSFR